MKNDARTRYTKKIIRECFFEQLKDTPLNKISVKSICDMAEINRTTFYRHYADPFDLMQQIEDEMMTSFQKYVIDFQNKNTVDAIETMIQAVKQNRELYLILISENADSLYISNMVTNSYKLYQTGFAKRYPELSETKQRWLYYFIAHGCIRIIIDWINSGMNESPREAAEFIAEIDDMILTHKFL